MSSPRVTPYDTTETYKITNSEPKQELSAGKIFSVKTDGNIQKTEFDFRQSTRERLGVDDNRRAEIALQGFAGKRLTYETTSREIH